ncbi:MAG: outer membrane lipid asymmetry maintenance protein MlaD [Burkholderiales bacterium]|nr:outer membrane lipid asymmetry maintenance protein MlaD [Burkholderiales bacterium]
MKRLAIDFTVGIFVLIGIGCLAFLSLKVANSSNIGGSANQSYTLFASFSNIGSLKVSAPVKVSGFVVGRVTDIRLNPTTYQAVVSMNINNEYKFSSDTSAQILTTGLLGEQYVALQSGAETDYLKNGDSISITSSAMVLEDLIGKFMTSMTSK